MTGANTAIISVIYLVCGVVIFLLGLTLLRVGRSSPPTRAAAESAERRASISDLFRDSI